MELKKTNSQEHVHLCYNEKTCENLHIVPKFDNRLGSTDAETLENIIEGLMQERRNFIADTLDCFTLLLARHLADVSCYIGPSMPSGIGMEIHTEIVQKRKKKPSHNKGTPRQPHVYL